MRKRFTEGDISVRDAIHIDEDNEVHFIDAFVDRLDMKELGFKHSERFDPGFVPSPGRPPHNPRDLLKLYLYGYPNTRRSSRKLRKECERNLEVKWLVKGLVPSYKAISEFRKENIGCIHKVFGQFVHFLDSLGLFSGDVVSVDGAKLKAVNAKDRNFTKKKLEEKFSYIDEKMEKYREELRMNDRKLDQYIPPSPPVTQAKEDDSCSSWKKKVRQKLQALLERKRKYTDIEKEMRESGRRKYLSQIQTQE